MHPEALDLLERKQYGEAYIKFQEISEYKNSAEMMLECRYLRGLELLDEKDYEGARERFIAVGEYKDAAALAKETGEKFNALLAAEFEYSEDSSGIKITSYTG